MLDAGPGLPYYQNMETLVYTVRADVRVGGKRTEPHEIFVAATSETEAMQKAQAETWEFLCRNGDNVTWYVLGAPKRAVLR